MFLPPHTLVVRFFNAIKGIFGAAAPAKTGVVGDILITTKLVLCLRLEM
jgi:hypothetical protein